MQITCNEKILGYAWCMRQTKSRHIIETTLQTHPRPITLQELYVASRRRLASISFSTVYRNMERLEDEHAVRRIDWRERGAHYEWVKGRPHHHHILCTDCGAFQELRDVDISLDLGDLAQTTGFVIHDHTVELSGLCPQCQKREPANDR